MRAVGRQSSSRGIFTVYSTCVYMFVLVLSLFVIADPKSSLWQKRLSYFSVYLKTTVESLTPKEEENEAITTKTADDFNVHTVSRK